MSFADDAVAVQEELARFWISGGLKIAVAVIVASLVPTR